MSTTHIVAVNRPGEPGWIAPGSEQHTAMISPSKVPAILGFSRWQSPYGLWMQMAGQVEADPPKDIFQVGHDAEPYMANRWRHLNPGWLLSPGEVQFVIDPDHFGFPALVTLDRRAVRGRARRVVQMKIARDLGDAEAWGDDLGGDDETPPDYAAQVFAEMLFSGFTQLPGHLMVAGPFWTEKLYPIRYDPSTAAGLITELQKFWRSLQLKTVPPLDDTVATYQTVRKLHPGIDAGSTVQLEPEMAADYLDALAAHKDAERRARGLKTEVLDAMGDTETAFVGAMKVAKRTPHASGSVVLSAARKTSGDDIRSLPKPKENSVTETTTAEHTEALIGPEPTRGGEVVTVTSTAASVAENFDEFELAVRRMLGLEDASDGEMRLFHHVCQKSGLDPFNREVYMIGRNTEVEAWEDNPDTGNRRKVSRWITKYTIQVGINGFRRRARDISAALGVKYEIGEPLWCGDDGDWREVWTSAKPPVAAKFTVFRAGQPYSFVAHYAEFVQTTRGGDPNSMWKKMPANQLRKCAEVGAIQMAFPDQLGGLILDEAAQPDIIDSSGNPAAPPRRRPEQARGVAALTHRVATAEPMPAHVENGPEPVVAQESKHSQTPAQRVRRKWLNRMFALLTEGQCPDRDDQLIVISSLAGRTDTDLLEHRDQLTDEELRNVVNAMNVASKGGVLGNVITDLLNTHTIRQDENDTAATTTEENQT